MEDKSSGLCVPHNENIQSQAGMTLQSYFKNIQSMQLFGMESEIVL
jgi:hypothetical protein